MIEGKSYATIRGLGVDRNKDGNPTVIKGLCLVWPTQGHVINLFRKHFQYKYMV